MSGIKAIVSNLKIQQSSKITLQSLILVTAFFVSADLQAQKNTKTANLVYVDKQGVLRWTKNNAEASFFGVNYTTPFAHAYRAHKVLNADLEKSIQQDVYHFARLGLDAFRVHVWDTEITDTAGNLLENDHLRLFDFLLAELKKRNIKTIITPIAFWGNGYPERDEMTPGFSRKYGKAGATTNDTAIKAQENYLKQFFKHVNPYTSLTYVQDPDVIAMEINNEPNHSGPKSGVTNYVNRLAAAVRSTGWTKPVYYNISQSPYYADAVAKAAIDGVSFQWYPTGLVANREVKGNFLPNVDRYTIPFDTIPEYLNKTRMVYEFDAADVLQSCMYPAMAKSFRGAGFQWATQFSYDPIAMAHANTEYQTHFLNLAYTPSKAISMLIASEVFHKVPRLKNYGGYPADSVFEVFRISYKNDLSEMNTESKFYHSNTTHTKPVAVDKLTNIAGVGSSALVKYSGSGAYFLDKLEDGVWRLEIMPDAAFIRDPFERASLKKEVVRLLWQASTMQVLLADLGVDFNIRGINDGNDFSGRASSGSFQIHPGTYLLTKEGKKVSPGKNKIGVIELNEFVAPKSFEKDLFLLHEPYVEVSPGKAFIISARIVGLDTGKATLQVRRLGTGQYRNFQMTRKSSTEYFAEVPANLVMPGILNYRIVIQQGNEYSVFPGNFRGDPSAWDYFHDQDWKTFVASEDGHIEIFNPTTDRTARIYPQFRRGFQSDYITAEKPGQLILRMAASELPRNQEIGFQYYFAHKLLGRITEIAAFDNLVIRARSAAQPVRAKVILTSIDGYSVSTHISLSNTFQDIILRIGDMLPDSVLLLPRPYPGFLPLKFKGAGDLQGFKLSEAEKIEMTIDSDVSKTYSFEVESIWLQKSK